MSGEAGDREGDGHILIVATLRTCHLAIRLSNCETKPEGRPQRTYEGGIVHEVGRHANLFSVWNSSARPCTTEVAATRPASCRVYQAGHVLCDRQQIVPIHALVLSNLVIVAYPARVDHDSPLGVCLGIEQVIAFRAKV